MPLLRCSSLQSVLSGVAARAPGSSCAGWRGTAQSVCCHSGFYAMWKWSLSLGSLMQLLQEVDIFIMARNLLLRRLFMEGIICKSEGAGLSTAWTRHRLRLLLCERCHRTALFLKRSSIFCMLVKKVQYWKLKVDNRELRSMSINFLCILPVYLYNFIVQITCSFIFK